MHIRAFRPFLDKGLP